MTTLTTTRHRRLASIGAVLGLTAVSLMASAPASADHVNSVVYSGQGLDGGGNIEEVICDDDNTPYVLFVLAGTKASAAHLDGDVVGSMTKSGGGNGGAYKLTAGIGGDLTDLIDNVTAYYDGPARNAQLVISHGCPGDDLPPS